MIVSVELQGDAMLWCRARYGNTGHGSETQNVACCTTWDIRMVWIVIQNDKIDGLCVQESKVHINTLIRLGELYWPDNHALQSFQSIVL